MRNATAHPCGLLAGVGVLIGVMGERPAAADEYAAKMERLIAVRQLALVGACSIPFDSVWAPTAVFSIPPDIHPARSADFQARYDPAMRTYVFNPKFIAALNRLEDEQPASVDAFFVREVVFRAAIDHELGHALTHDIALRHGETLWFDERYARLPTDQRLALTMVREGVANYFARLHETERTPIGFGILPHTWKDPAWQFDYAKIVNEGGYSIVKPILERYGERGIVYLLSHQLFFPEGNADDAGLAYQKEALKVLAGE